MAQQDSTQTRVQEILRVLSDDSVTRAAVIRALARDYPDDFLSPVKINPQFTATGAAAGIVISDKEWQE